MSPDDETAALPVQHPPAVPEGAAPVPVVPVQRLALVVVAPDVPAPPVHRFGDLPAYFVERMFAFAIDTFVVAFIVATFAFNVQSVSAFGTPQRVPNPAGFPMLALISLGCACVFAFLCEGLFGSTLGKLLFSLGVGLARGGSAGLGRAFARRLLVPVDALLIGPVLALVTPRHQRLGDVVAGTVVARSRIGPLAPVVSLLAFAAIAYAQIVYGGGLSSAIGVAAEGAAFFQGTQQNAPV
jgi:uncharacterized RDD family membrane protein YckC